MTDWDEHLVKIDRRTKAARRITSYVVLFLLVAVGLWTFVPMVWPKSPSIIQESRAAESCDSNSIVIENTGGSIILTATGTSSDYITIDAAGEDCVMVTSSAGGIDISYGGTTNGDEIIIENNE